MSTAIRLVPPSVSRYASFVDCIADFAGTPMDGASVFDPTTPPLADADFVDYVTELLSQEDPATELDEPWVHCTSRWIMSVDGADEILGFLAIRHGLNRHLFDQGGHIGYSVRPSARRRGIASAALELGLQEARALGIAPVLITCDEGNVASRATIEKAGGQYENSIEGTLRYWVGDETTPQRP